MKTILSSKRDHLLAEVCVFLIIAALIAGMGGCVYTPPPENLEIRDWYDLDAVRNNLTASYILMNDLDSTTAGYTELASPTANGGKGWQPIGAWGGRFTGSLDGQGYEIRDLFIARPDDDWVGLFTVVDGTGVVRNVGVVNANVSGGDYEVGALIGRNRGTVLNCYSTGSVSGSQWVGGLVGVNDGWGDMVPAATLIYASYSPPATIEDSYSAAFVSGNKSGIGGLVGNNDAGTVSRSYSTGDVSGDTWVGGLMGTSGGSIRDCYCIGSVTGYHLIGGLVGYNMGGTVSNSYYNYDEVLINGQNIITIGALFDKDFEEWLAKGRFLDVNERLSQEDGYYVVNNVTDFKDLLAFGQNSSLKFRLKNDLDLATEKNFYIPYFAGEFDGNGHKISNLSFNTDFISQIGLFGCLASGGKVTQVGVETVNITGDRYVGGLVGWNEGTVSNCYFEGGVTGTIGLGGLVGNNWNGAVSNSYSTGNVAGTYYAGGLVGGNDGTVSNSYATGNVTGYMGVGGLVGENYYGTVNDSYSTGSVSGNTSIGGLVGYNFLGPVSNSFWDIETSGQATSDGGTGKNTTEMQDIATFSGAGWNIITVANPGTRNPSYIWNIVNNVTYPFLSWQP